MPAGEEVLCAVRDAQSGAAIVDVGAAVARAQQLRLVVVHVRGGPGDQQDELHTLGAELRLYDGSPVAVLQGLGRAVATAWLVIGADPLGPTAQALMDTRGCPLLMVRTRANGALPSHA